MYLLEKFSDVTLLFVGESIIEEVVGDDDDNFPSGYRFTMTNMMFMYEEVLSDCEVS